MKKLLNLGIAAALLASCAPQLPKDQYQLSGNIQGVDNQNIYMMYAIDETATVTDTAQINNGAFTFAGKLEKPFLYATLYIGSADDYTNRRFCNVYIEPQAMTITIDTANFDKPVITGSFTQAQADSVKTAIEAIRNEAADIYKAIETETDHEKASELRDQLEPFIERMQKLEAVFVKTHPNSYVAPYYLQSLMGEMTYGEVKEIYDSFSDNVKKYGDVKKIEEELTALSRVQPGMPAPDFATLNVKGDSIRFSEAVKDKYVLLDFWASWCVPCRKSFPHVKELYKKYHDKGLEVFCVADNDTQENVWREAIKKDGVEMFHHVLRGMKVIDEKTFKLDRTNDISEKYAIHFLPTKYLIDKDFKIIGKFNDEELDDKLKEIFGE